MKNWPDPTEQDIISPEFEAVWNCIKGWDIGLPWDIDGVEGHQLYSGATGNHVMAILDALKSLRLGDKKLLNFIGTRVIRTK